MEISLKHFSKRDDLVTRSITGETIIVPIQGHVGDLDGIYTLNDVGTTIWDLIDGKVSVGQIVDTVRNEYDVPPEDLKHDLIALVSELSAQGLVIIEDGAGSPASPDNVV